jgi:hypothetical protein
MTLVTAIVSLAVILFYFFRPVVALILGAIVVLSLIALWPAIDKEIARRAKDYEEAKSLTHTAIKLDELSVRDVTLVGMVFYPGRFLLHGTVTNNSKYPLKSIRLEITITDCPSPTLSDASGAANACKIIGQRSIGTDIDVPPNQTRAFETKPLVFDNIPDPERCLDDAAGTWPAEAKCSEGRSFAWKITDLEASGFGY